MIRKRLFLLVLAVLVIGLAFLGYQRPTFLVSWDALMALCGF
ncbi:MAG: hypothetical protein WCY07_12210 [Pigmentiphaga sp.]